MDFAQRVAPLFWSQGWIGKDDRNFLLERIVLCTMRFPRWTVLAALTVVGAACASNGPSATPLRASSGGQYGTLMLISEGSVHPMVLSDGTPVWEVRHGDGTVSVLGAAVSPTPEAVHNALVAPLPGVEVVAEWLKPDHRFDAGGVLYNDQGTALGYTAPQVGGNPALPTTARDMTSYDAQVLNDEVVVGAARQGTVRHFDAHKPASPPRVYMMNQIVTFNPPGRPLLPVLTVGQALAQPAGTMSLVDADVIIVNGGPARVCSADHRTDRIPFPPCPASSPELPVVSNPSGHGYVSAVAGPIFLRTGHSGFTEAAAFGAGGGEYAITGQIPNPNP